MAHCKKVKDHLTRIPLRNKNYFYKNEIILPDVTIESSEENNQILHYVTANRNIDHHCSTKKFVDIFLRDAHVLRSDAEMLTYALGCIDPTLNGLITEFGVCTGKTINIIAALNPFSIIAGFDSFEGIQEDWRVGAPKYTFKITNGELPPLLANVDIYKGYFDETIPTFVKDSKGTPLSFIHVDCDLYSSTKTIFSMLKEQIVPGTIILFDEYFNYDGWERHEHKAFQEFIKETHRTFTYLAYNRYHEQVLVRINA